MPNENTSNLAWRHAYTIVELPEPPASFTKADSPLSHSELQLFRENDLIEKAPHSDSIPHEWRVDTDVWERAVNYVEETEAFECCGSRGVTNVDGQLECIDCGETVTPQEYRRVIK